METGKSQFTFTAKARHFPFHGLSSISNDFLLSYHGEPCLHHADNLSMLYFPNVVRVSSHRIGEYLVEHP